MAGLLAVSGYSLATSGDNLPYHLPVRDCGAALGIRRWRVVTNREVLLAGPGLPLDSAVRMGGHTNDQLEGLDEGADAVVADGDACFRDGDPVR